jgi:hypothetical protein
MKIAYVDSSCLVGLALGEPAGLRIAGRLQSFERQLASNLLEAEFRSALAREKADDGGERLLSWLTWVHPDRPLTAEFTRLLAHGFIRGADLWHLACALFVAPNPRDLSFLTLDAGQKALARRVGFTV